MINEKTVVAVLDALKKDNYECFSSEAQLRDAFAIKLREIYPNCVVIPEYTHLIPAGWGLSEEKNIFFDLLIKDCDNNERILVEFKYKTKEGTFRVHSDVDIVLSNQSDTTNGRYAAWRDIYRIEHFINNNEIAKGFFIFLTNNKTYYSSPKPSNLDVNFSLEPGMHIAEDKVWNFAGHSTNSIHAIYRADIKPLSIVNDYFFNYLDYSHIKDNKGHEHVFKQLIVPIYSNSLASELEKNLRKMGKGVFVEYFNLFKTEDAEKCKVAMGGRFAPKSINTRVSCGINIFRNKQEVEALRLIVASSKVDETLRAEAKEILDSI